MASRTAWAPCPASAGPLWTRAGRHGRACGQVQQQREPRGALHQHPDRRAAQPQDESPSQCPGTARSATSAGRWLIRTSGVRNCLPARGSVLWAPAAPTRCPGTRSTHRATRRGPGGPGLVDRLMGDPHRPIIGEVDPQPARDLLRSPRPGPAPVRAAPVTASDPANLGTGHRRAVGRGDPAGKPVLHLLPARVMAGELGHLRAPGTPIGVPGRGRGPILQQAATGRGVAAQLPRDRRRRPADPPSDLGHAAALALRTVISSRSVNDR
jgi:hypothetical protein